MSKTKNRSIFHIASREIISNLFTLSIKNSALLLGDTHRFFLHGKVSLLRKSNDKLVNGYILREIGTRWEILTISNELFRIPSLIYSETTSEYTNSIEKLT